MPDLTEAQRQLYAAAPADFLDLRTQLVAQARAVGDAAAATAIGKLRKPTVAAWIVNTLAVHRPQIMVTLTELGAALRQAQGALDAGRLRELSTQRRAVVSEMTRDAFALAGRRDPSAAVRDEVSGTFDAALADPDIASRLGRLDRAQQWSGFGFDTTAAPELTLVRGGQADTRSATPPHSNRPSAAERRKEASERQTRERALTTAQHDFDRADAEHQRARATEQELTARVRRLGDRLRGLQREIDEAKSALEGVREELKTARTSRRQARSALDAALRKQ